jgi:hypothetical protein
MYAIETVTIPPKDLLLWKSLLIGIQGWTPYSNTWIKYILSYEWIYISIAEEPLIVGSSKPPTNCKPLTRGKLETLAFLAMTGECNE